MRTITLIIIHCSATRSTQHYSFDACRSDHIGHRRFTDIGYHFYITRDGLIHPGRDLDRKGAHCLHHNDHSIGICYEGGLDADGHPADTRTPGQRAALYALLKDLVVIYPKALIVGHRDLDPRKACPSFDVHTDLAKAIHNLMEDGEALSN